MTRTELAHRIRGDFGEQLCPSAHHPAAPDPRPPSVTRGVQITQTSETPRVSISTHRWELEKKTSLKKKTVNITNFKDCSVINYTSAMLGLLFFFYILLL